MILDRSQVRDLYRRTARIYDSAVWMYRLTGIARFRDQAISQMALGEGDTVVDMGCGTGLNLPSLSERVGSTGRVIGVDLTDAMLERAQDRVTRLGLSNVELVEADLLEFEFPDGMSGAIATFALEMVPEYDEVIRRVAAALAPGGKLVLLGLKHPERWPEWLIRLGVLINRPFGVSPEYEKLRPWESARKHLSQLDYREHYGGAGYVWIGASRGKATVASGPERPRA